jgi:hypothetical protein
MGKANLGKNQTCSKSEESFAQENMKSYHPVSIERSVSKSIGRLLRNFWHIRESTKKTVEPLVIISGCRLHTWFFTTPIVDVSMRR